MGSATYIHFAPAHVGIFQLAALLLTVPCYVFVMCFIVVIIAIYLFIMIIIVLLLFLHFNVINKCPGFAKDKTMNICYSSYRLRTSDRFPTVCVS